MSPRSDLNKKLALEKRLADDLRTYNARIVREFTSTFARLGMISPTQELDKQLAATLNGHYAAARAAFAGSISEEMPPQARLTTSERLAIAAALVAFFKRKSEERAADINRSTDQDMRDAVRIAYDTQKPEQPPLSRLEVAFIAAGLLDRSLKARAGTIATTETQLAAEATKATEAEVLIGLNPTVSGGDPKSYEAMKQWDSVADNRVREAHLEADGQQVPINEPFRVDGESLMFPGDTSLGASAGNVINCRCSASYDTAGIARRRMEEAGNDADAA